MSSTSVTDADNPAIINVIDDIEGYATYHIRHQRTIRLLSIELLLPEGLASEENLLFLEFAGSYRQFMDQQHRAPFCIWQRDLAGTQQRYLVGWMLNDYPSLPPENDFKAAETIWRKTLGLPDTSGLIRRNQEDRKLKWHWNDNPRLIGLCNRWLKEMRERARQIPDPQQALRSFGAVHGY